MKKIIYRIIGIIVTIYLLYASIIYVRLFISSKTLDENQKQDFVHFTIFGSSTNDEVNTVSAHFSIVDSRGNIITEIERSWNGNYLAIEFAQSELNGKYFIFPSRIYAKERIIEGGQNRKFGTELEKYYEENNQCILLGTKSRKDRENLYVISRFTNKKFKVPTFNVVSTYTLDLSNCKTETYYTISCDANGKLTLHQR